MAATLTRPTPPDVGDDNPDVAHMTCCDPDTALCGLDVSGLDWVIGEEPPEGFRCKFCVIVYENGWACPVPGCTP